MDSSFANMALNMDISEGYMDISSTNMALNMETSDAIMDSVYGMVLVCVQPKNQ